jgi:molybdopterin synthase sulfur carrier subunit
MADTITVTYRGSLSELTKCKEETVPAAAVRDVIDHIKAAHGGNAVKAAKTMLITVNGRSILKLNLYKTPLKAGDTVSFLPICAGG